MILPFVPAPIFFQARNCISSARKFCPVLSGFFRIHKNHRVSRPFSLQQNLFLRHFELSPQIASSLNGQAGCSRLCQHFQAFLKVWGVLLSKVSKKAVDALCLQNQTQGEKCWLNPQSQANFAAQNAALWVASYTCVFVVTPSIIFILCAHGTSTNRTAIIPTTIPPKLSLNKTDSNNHTRENLEYVLKVCHYPRIQYFPKLYCSNYLQARISSQFWLHTVLKTPRTFYSDL